MAGLDYPGLQQTAKRLIEENGQTLTIKQVTHTPTDSSKPWRGGGADTFSSVITCIGVIIPNDELDDKEAMRRGDAVGYVAQLSFESGSPPTLQDLVAYDTVTDSDGYDWHLHGVKIINPGGTRIMYELVLEH